MKRLLVTGASGLLGLNLALQAAGEYAVTGVTHAHALRGTPFEALPTDLSDPDTAGRLIKGVRPDILIHCAAIANLDVCESHPEEARRVNTELPGRLAGICKRIGIRMIYISTDAVFDGQRGDYSEDDAPNPLGVYARSKLAGEQAVSAACPDALIARVVFYGWSLSGKRSLAEFFYTNLSAGRPVNGFTDVVFCPLLVNDLANFLLKLAEGRWGGVMHVVSSESLTKYEFGVRLARRFGLDEQLIKPVTVSEGGLAAARSPHLTLRNERFVNALGSPPNQAAGLERFYRLCQEGYPAKIRSYAAGDNK